MSLRIAVTMCSWALASCSDGARIHAAPLTFLATRQANHSATARENILANDRRFWQAAGDHDLTTLGELIADHYQGTTPDGTRWDKISVLAQHQAVRTGDLVRITEPEVVCVSAAAAILTYEAKFSIFARDGALLDRAQQRMLSCWIRQDGRWQLAFAQVSDAPSQDLVSNVLSDAPLPGAASQTVPRQLATPDNVDRFGAPLDDHPAKRP